jgi:hypothetical protein
MYVDGTLGLYRPVSHAGNLQFVYLNGTELVDETSCVLAAGAALQAMVWPMPTKASRGGLRSR